MFIWFVPLVGLIGDCAGALVRSAMRREANDDLAVGGRQVDAAAVSTKDGVSGLMLSFSLVDLHLTHHQ
jgi:hypothetical protein